MPVIKSAKKKLRQDKKRTALNNKLENLFKNLVKEAKKSPTQENIKEAISAVDKAAKKNIIHKNKAARLKSALAKSSKKAQSSKVKVKGSSTLPSKKKIKKKSS